MVSKLLRKNISPARIIGFVLSNFLGLAIVTGAIQFYSDASSIWEDEESFVRSDYIVINKKVTSANTFGRSSSGFSGSELSDLQSQPWVRKAAPFTAADYKVYASLEAGGRGVSTAMFFESIPDDYVDVPPGQWRWQEGDPEVPMIISKDYLTLYNFGFASGAGLPQMSEGLMSGIPVRLTLRSEDGTRTLHFNGRIAGYSNRLNTILVPRNFMELTNSQLGGAATPDPSRIIIDTNSPGDVAIGDYMESHDYEIAGDKSAASASFLLKLIIGIVTGIGVVITLLSFFILMLSVSLLMEKNRDKLHSLIMLGYPLKRIEAPYKAIIGIAAAMAWILSVGVVLLLRGFYLRPLQGLGAGEGTLWLALGIGLALTLLIILFNFMAVSRKVRKSFRVTR